VLHGTKYTLSAVALCLTTIKSHLTAIEIPVRMGYNLGSLAKCVFMRKAKGG